MHPLLGKVYSSLTGRSPQWPALRKRFLTDNSACEACGGKSGLEVHHRIPFHLDRERELAPSNLMTLCRPHHLLVGHLMSWRSWNVNAHLDAGYWRQRVSDRPSQPVGAFAPSRRWDVLLQWLGF